MNLKETEQKIELAKRQQEILNLFYKCLGKDYFDTNIPLENFETSRLKDFWTYTAGFLGVNNYEQDKENITPEQAKEMINGSFVLQSFTKNEAREFILKCGKQVEKDFPSTVELYQIKDAKFVMSKIPKSAPPIYRFMLKAPPITVESVEKGPIEDNDPVRLLKHIRNVIVHETPFVSTDEKTLFYSDNDTIINIPSMWLRGYSETFANNASKIKTESIQNILAANCKQQMLTKQDVNNALSSLKNYFGEDIHKNFFKVNIFVNKRIDFYDNFYSLPLDEQIKILSEILLHNENSLSGNAETINPSIIYNLEQIVAKQITKNSENQVVTILKDKSALDVINIIFKSLNKDNHIKSQPQALDEVQDALNKGVITGLIDADGGESVTANLLAYIKILKTGANSNKQSNLLKFCDNLYKNTLKTIEYTLASESSRMELFDTEGLKYLTVEVAQNLVCLMGYNNLVTNSFYQDIIADKNFEYLPKSIPPILNQINFDGITCTTFQNQKTFTPRNKIFMLNIIRTALCHGSIVFELPPQKKNENLSYKDAVISFNIVGDYKAEVKGTVESFYNLFNSYGFSASRKAVYDDTLSAEEAFRQFLYQNSVPISPEEIAQQSEELFNKMNEIASKTGSTTTPKKKIDDDPDPNGPNGPN